MNYKISLFAAIAFFTAVSADRTVIVLLNNGTSDANSGSCTAADLVKTNAVIEKSSLNTTYGYQRYLRTNDLVDKDDMTESMLLEQSGHRDLASYSVLCKDYCRGQTPGYCVARGCVGYRRRELGEPGDRNLLSGAAFTCTQQVNYINTELNNLVSQNNVTSSCKTLLMKPRNITCFDDVIYGVVESYNLWRAQSVSIYNYKGTDIERYHPVSFEAFANDCVDSLKIVLTGPNNFRVEREGVTRPFLLPDSSNGTIHHFGATELGQYELNAIPDGFVEKARVLQFKIVPNTMHFLFLWKTNNSSKTIVHTAASGNVAGDVNFGNICNNMKVNLEAYLPYATSVKITITSTNGFSKSIDDSISPFTIFGEVNHTVYNGQYLLNGSYNMTVYPDKVMSSTAVRSYVFNVVSCP